MKTLEQAEDILSQVLADYETEFKICMETGMYATAYRVANRINMIRNWFGIKDLVNTEEIIKNLTIIK